MASTDFLSGLLSPIGDAIIERDQRAQQDKLQKKRDRIAILTAALPQADDPNLILNELWELTGGGARGKGGRPNPGMTMLETLVRANVGKKTGPQFDMTTVTEGTPENAAAGNARRAIAGQSMDPRVTDMLDRGPKFDYGQRPITFEEVQVERPIATDLGDLPFRLPTRADREARALEDFKARELFETEQIRARNEGKLLPGSTLIMGAQIPPDVQADVDGQPIDRSGGARYKRLDRQGQAPVFIREAGRVPTGDEAKVHEAARQLVAVAASRGESLDFDQALNMARVENRLTGVRDRQLKQMRLEQLLQAGELAFKRGTQQYEQAAQMFPLLMEARRAGIDLTKARQALVSGNPVTIMNQALTQARALASQPGSAYFGKDLSEAVDAVLSELGFDPAEIRARASVMASGNVPAAVDPSRELTVDQKDPDLRAKAKKILQDEERSASDADVDALLADPAWVKYLKGEGE